MAATETFAARLAIARKLWEDRLGQGEQPDKAFAEALDFGATYLSGLQRSITPPPHDRVLIIAKLTGADPGWLTYGDETDASAPGAHTTPKRQGKAATVEAERARKPAGGRKKA